MTRSYVAQSSSRKAKRRRRAPSWPSARLRRRAWRAFLAAPLFVQLLLGTLTLVMMWAAVNWVYQVVRKPTELYFPVSGVLSKTPAETWRKYQPIFRAHATDVISAELLAALAQVEASGNPVARTYWRWRPTWDPFQVYRPASSAVGMYQITDAAFAEARRYCIHDHAVVEVGSWNDMQSCWFNMFYMRVVPSHAVEMTSAVLDRHVAGALARSRRFAATLEQKQNLAALIHLCGTAAGDAYAKRGFILTPRQRCGDHDARGYLARVNAMKRMFAQMDVTAGHD